MGRRRNSGKPGTTNSSSRIWDLAGLNVMRIVIDPAQVSFLLASGFVGDADAIDLIIENAFTISDGHGMTHAVNPAAVESLAPVLSLRLRPTHSLVASRDGSLVLRFEEGAELRVPKHGLYESWHTFGHGDLADASMLCSPHEGPPWAE
jgi:hypothetical protein